MRVDGSNQANQAAQAKQTNKSDAAERAERKGAEAKSHAAGDASTEISTRGKEFLKAKEVALAAPDTREAKIAELRRRIENKEYNVKPSAIADRMVDDHLKSSGLR